MISAANRAALSRSSPITDTMTLETQLTGATPRIALVRELGAEFSARQAHADLVGSPSRSARLPLGHVLWLHRRAKRHLDQLAPHTGRPWRSPRARMSAGRGRGTWRYTRSR